MGSEMCIRDRGNIKGAFEDAKHAVKDALDGDKGPERR